jgi:hypothetical protein
MATKDVAPTPVPAPKPFSQDVVQQQAAPVNPVDPADPDKPADPSDAPQPSEGYVEEINPSQIVPPVHARAVTHYFGTDALNRPRREPVDPAEEKARQERVARAKEERMRRDMEVADGKVPGP